jgi:hypothetical protein
MHSLEIKLLFMVVVWMKAHVFAKQEGALLLTNIYKRYKYNYLVNIGFVVI